MHISRVAIKNYRNFLNFDLENFPAPAVIVGENGVGKTNLLRALCLVLDPSMPDTARILRDDDIFDGAAHGLAEGVKVSIIVELEGYEDNTVTKAMLTTTHVSISPLTARLTYEFRPMPHLATERGDGSYDLVAGRALTRDDYEFQIIPGHQRDKEASRTLRRNIYLKVLPALRDAESDLRNWRRNPLADLLEKLPIDKNILNSAAEDIATAMDKLREDKNVAGLQKRIRDRLSSMVGPQLPTEPTLGFSSANADDLIREIQLFVDANRRRGIAESSLGTSNILYLCLLLDALDIQRSRDDFVEALLGVEEPEAHLHVGVQRRLFKHLLATHTGLLLTTHSPHIAAVTPAMSLVKLVETPKGCVGTSLAQAKLSHQQITDLERYIDANRAEMLFARFVILVEGSAEMFVVPALAAACGFDLDSYGVIISNVHGTDFTPYWSALGPTGWNVPHVVVTDGDRTADAHGYVESGVRRAGKLVGTRDGADDLSTKITNLDSKTLLERSASDSLLAELRKKSILVGQQTLETDLAVLYGSEMVGAFEELSTNANARADFRDGIDNEKMASPDLAIRKIMLDRINPIGKGRYAQRLAAKIESVDLRERLYEDTNELNAKERQEHIAALIGPAMYLFKALSKASHAVGRGTLVVAPAAAGESESAQPGAPGNPKP